MEKIQPEVLKESHFEIGVIITSHALEIHLPDLKLTERNRATNQNKLKTFCKWGSVRLDIGEKIKPVDVSDKYSLILRRMNTSSVFATFNS